MADAIFHAEYAPFSGLGGVCATGEILLGPGSATSPYPNRFTIFNPSTRKSRVLGATLPVAWERTSHGVPYDGGVAVIASTAGSSDTTCIVVMYPDDTYTVIVTPFSVGANATLGVDGSGRIWVYRTTTEVVPRVYDPSTASWLAPFGAPLWMKPSPVHYSGGVLWCSTFNNYVVGVTPSTGAIATLYASVGLPGFSQFYDGRMWGGTSTTNVRGVRLSDGNVVNIPVPSTDTDPLWVDATGLWRANSLAAYRIDLLTLDTVTYVHPSSIGTVGGLYRSGGRVWATGNNPTS